MLNIQKGTKLIFAGIILAVAIGYILTSLGATQYLLYASAGLGVLFGLFLYVEGGVYDYYKKKGYKTIGVGDALVWLAFIFGTFIIANSLLIFGGVRDNVPEAIANFLAINGAVGGALAGVLAIAFLFLPKPQ
tara:strand:- start:4846 stop:5244 length:399 start_codon:yes stop_codon:yes gene_type:complete